MSGSRGHLQRIGAVLDADLAAALREYDERRAAEGAALEAAGIVTDDDRRAFSRRWPAACRAVSAKALLVAIANHAGTERELCWASMPTLELETGLERKAIGRTAAVLAAMGLVEITDRRHAKGGGSKTNVYRPIFDELERWRGSGLGTDGRMARDVLSGGSGRTVASRTEREPDLERTRARDVVSQAREPAGGRAGGGPSAVDEQLERLEAQAEYLDGLIANLSDEQLERLEAEALRPFGERFRASMTDARRRNLLRGRIEAWVREAAAQGRDPDKPAEGRADAA